MHHIKDTIQKKNSSYVRLELDSHVVLVPVTVPQAREALVKTKTIANLIKR